MKAITVWQPWAGAMAAGIKENETRSWATKYRGPIAIHAGKKQIPLPWDGVLDDPTWRLFYKILGRHGINLYYESGMVPPDNYEYKLKYGEVIAIAELVDCIRITPEYITTLTPDELALGDYTPGRYAWKLANVQKLPEPIPAKGRQGLWNWDALLLRHKGRDSWDRPVYEDESGKLWKDVEPRADDEPKLCSALYNAFDGEPDTPLEVMERYKNKAIVFIPKRDTWTW